MPSQLKSPPNPGQEEYERNFDFERREREQINASANGPDNSDERAGTDRAKAWSPDNRPLSEQEAAPSWSTANLNRTSKQPSDNGGAVSNILKKRAKRWAIGGGIALLLGISAAVPAAVSGALANLKELGSDWANKNNHSYYSKRTQRNMQKKLFQADENCKSGVKCRYKTGVSDKEIDKMKKAGLNPEIEEKGGKKYVKAFNTTDVEGKTVRITADNFGEHYSSNTRFRGRMDAIAKPKSMLLRGKQTLRLVFDKFKIKRNRTISGADDRERNKNFRADIYGEGNDVERANSAPPSDNEEDNQKMKGVDDSINEAANQERARLSSSGYDRPPSVVPDVSNLDLDPSRAVDVGNGLLKEGAKSSFKGALAAVDKACSGYNFIRAATFGAKIYKALALVKYTVVFMTIADKLKAGDSDAAEIAYIMGILLVPSAKKESSGKTFFQSEGFHLISQGKIADHRGLARFTTGTPFLRFLQGGKKKLESLGANRQNCKQVKSWYGQTALIIGGLALSIGSGGWAIVAGAAAGAGIGMLVSALTAYIMPLLIQYAAGTVAPDPTDPEGGYGAGNAIAAGLGAFGHSAGAANGERTLTAGDATAVEMESNKEIAFMNKVDNYGKSPFSLDSATSVTNQLAMAVAPVATAPLSQSALQNVASVIASPLSLLGASIGNIVTRGVNAQSDISRGGAFCADEDYKQMSLAVDAFCNPIPGEKESVIMDPKYDPEAVLDYMLANGHIDDNGDAKSDEYKKFVASCVDSIVPISPDGGGSDVGEDVDTRWCIDTGDKFNYFRFYTADSAIDSAHEDSVNDTLGSSSSGSSSGKTYDNGKLPTEALCDLGDPWAGQKLRCGNATDKFKTLASAFKAQFNKDLTITSSYRTYDQQSQCSQSPGSDNCVSPGTSWHGCGQAVDLGGGVQSFDSGENNWMLTNASTYGWIAPSWAQKNGTNPAPWHWEYSTDSAQNAGLCPV
jgi:hypothetical protein